MRSVVAVVCLLLLAGCTEPELPDSSLEAAATPTDNAPPPTAKPWTLETFAFSFDGKLGTQVHGCVFPAGICQTHAVVPESDDLFVERPGANLTALAIEVTWQAPTPATQELWVGAMVMTSCEGCNDTEFPDVHGASPLRLDVQDVSVPLSDEASVHIYVYNPKGLVHDPAVPGYAVVSAEQAYHIEGTATFLVPPA